MVSPECLGSGLNQHQSGIFAGLTVYTVPQVIAATAPLGATSVQVGTLVKLVRVLMLGPVLLALSLSARVEGPEGRHRLDYRKLLPAFIRTPAARHAGSALAIFHEA